MINIRKATYDDYESFAQVEKEVSDLHAKQNPLVFQFTEGYSFSREYFEDLIGKKDHQFLLAEDSKMIVGYAIAYPKESEYLSILRPRKWMFLMSFGVKNSHKRQRIGSLLLDQLEARTIELGMNSIELSVYSFNEEAIKFYEKKGFEPHSIKMQKKL